MAKSPASPIPNVELYARSIGKFQWTCPNCGQDHPLTFTPWRRGDMSCRRCKARFRMGLGFSTSKTWSAHLMGKFNGYTANKLNPLGTGYDGARVYGSIEWQCPNCLHPQRSFLDYSNRLECESCAHPYFISLLIYRSVRHMKVRAPFDSLVPNLNAKKNIQSFPAAETGEGPGTPSNSPRGDR